MAFEDLLKTGQNQAQTQSSSAMINFASTVASAHHDQLLKREEILQSIMIAQGEYDYLALELKSGQNELLPDLLEKKSFLLERNIILANVSGKVDPSDLSAVNQQSDQLTKYRMELEAIKQSRGQDSPYVTALLQVIKAGVDFEGVMIDSLEQYLTLISEKLKFGGIVDQGRVSRLCGFASMAAKKGNLLLALRAYSTAGMIASIHDDFKNILKKAKKNKNPQYQEAETLLNNLAPKNKKK